MLIAIHWEIFKILGISNTMFSLFNKTLNHLKIKDMTLDSQSKLKSQL